MGLSVVKVDPDEISSECPICGFEADRDVIGKPNMIPLRSRGQGFYAGVSGVTPPLGVISFYDHWFGVNLWGSPHQAIEGL